MPARTLVIRGGNLKDPRFGKRMRGEGIFADQIFKRFAPRVAG